MTDARQHRLVRRVEQLHATDPQFRAAAPAPNGPITTGCLRISPRRPSRRWAPPAPPTGGVQIPAEKFRAAVQSAGIGAIHDVPHLSEELIAKYIADLRRLGLLDDAG